ncbi:hypothetical protein LO762_06140 [Actinocorallia sp. API 0066]|uniref:hypothetical protein n=1 Tax=Actinocorallia sp. API 0066 TaxID=2896846 RepID=UPI001E328FFD|nr:hypothetical protein [Actinocorallia sp. API 0066]MCD0448776.1 hypothetical protein [Actinocorallia sp. API 0066]
MPEPITPQDLLETSPYEDTLEEALAARPPRARLPVATLALGAGVVAVAGFLGGIQADRHWGPDTTPAAQAPQRGTFPGGGPGGGPGGFPGGVPGGFPGGGQGGFPGNGQGGPQGNRPTTGTVIKVSATTLELTTPDGQTVKINLTDQTTVTTTRPGTTKDLKPGTQVTIRGDQITTQPTP